ncbi:hypothetical protein GQ43DRAFT_468169 [Delitschia confertaspora ATCC 74209]|uniref:Uncharacterized protein n=1 Tax=Delitschia confertaspora ATCC 74209 TaxID=1513339 RepID=A0A9P4JTC9_9PLEO|nr:hypothetical protein GQ43DRAFT_468169 [Delitschia confertaspora ATCC 74209]
MAAAPMKSVIISYPNETPDSIVEDAMRAIKDAGGQITHTYNIIKGFACTAPQLALESVQSLSAKYTALIEEDGVVHTQGGKSGMGI